MAHNKLYYFGVAGRGEFPKLVLEEAGEQYEWVRVGQGENKKAPLADKLAFGQVPLWEEAGGFTLVQTGAITRYLARKHNLYPADLHDGARADQIYEGATDYAGAFFTALFGDQNAKDHHNKDVIPKYLANFEKLLVSNHEGKGFFVGDKISFADLAIFQILNWAGHISPDSVKTYPHLHDFHDRIRNRPNIQNYLKSDRFPTH